MEEDGVDPSRRLARPRESEERFRDLVEITSDWIWEVDANGVYTYSSPKVRDILGYEPQEIVGKTPFELMVPEDAEKTLPEFQRHVESKEPIVGLVNRNRHRDGRLVVDKPQLQHQEAEAAPRLS